MDKLTESQMQAYRAVDDALHTYPLEPAPPDLLPEVMRRIQNAQVAAQTAAPHRDLRWDWSYSLGFAALLALLLAWRLAVLLPLDWTARAQFQLFMWQHRLNYLLPHHGITVGLAIMFAGLLLGAGLLAWQMALKGGWRMASIEFRT